MEKKSVKIGDCYDDIVKFKELTGISITKAIDKAWKNFKTTKEYAMLVLFSKDKGD